MKPAWRQAYRQIIILVLVVGLFTGCASVFRDFDDWMNRKQFRSDYASFETALSVYRNGEYEQAMVLFKTLSNARTNPKLARKAWLGEICCHLMMAVTQSDYTAAIGLWHDFGKSAPDDDDAWDLALLDPVIVRMTPKSTTRVIEIYPPATPISDDTQAPVERRQGELPPVDQRYPTKLSALEKKAAQLQRQLEAVDAENRSLKEKIKALEAIDQNIQKKKTEIAAPSE